MNIKRNQTPKFDLGGYELTTEEMEKMQNRPERVAWINLCERIDAGTATPEEVEQYNYRLEPYDEMEPNVLYADMPHAEFEKMMREKRAKRLAAEAEAADQKPE